MLGPARHIRPTLILIGSNDVAQSHQQTPTPHVLCRRKQLTQSTQTRVGSNWHRRAKLKRHPKGRSFQNQMNNLSNHVASRTPAGTQSNRSRQWTVYRQTASKNMDRHKQASGDSHELEDRSKSESKYATWTYEKSTTVHEERLNWHYRAARNSFLISSPGPKNRIRIM